MTRLTVLLTATLLIVGVGVAQARDVGPSEALKLRDTGSIMNFEPLNAAAIARHPGSTVHDTELEEEHGRFIYQIDLRDPQGVHWELELDAATGEILKDAQDD